MPKTLAFLGFLGSSFRNTPYTTSQKIMLALSSAYIKTLTTALYLHSFQNDTVPVLAHLNYYNGLLNSLLASPVALQSLLLHNSKSN